MAGELPYETAKDVTKKWCRDNDGSLNYGQGVVSCKINGDDLMVRGREGGDLYGVNLWQESKGDGIYVESTEPNIPIDSMSTFTKGLTKGRYGMEDAEFDDSTNLKGESIYFEIQGRGTLKLSPE